MLPTCQVPAYIGKVVGPERGENRYKESSFETREQQYEGDRRVG